MERLSPMLQYCEDVGILKGRIDGIQAMLEFRFGSEGLSLMPRIRQLHDPEIMEQLLRASISVTDLEAFRNLLPPQPQA